MFSVSRCPRRMQPLIRGIVCGIICLVFGGAGVGYAADLQQSALPVKGSEAKTEGEMKPYAELIEHTDAKIEMVPIKGGTYTMGSPEDEPGRSDEEGPQHAVKIDPFWMGKHEITWDAFDIWIFDMDIQRRRAAALEPNERDLASEEYQLSQPTAPYADMSFGMGKRGYPAICMTQFAARVFCMWLSEKTGRYYRLPTEAEWEYACRAGTETAYSFGDAPDDLEDYGWFYDNSTDAYQQVGKKKPNPWGLCDMHGNVAEWVLDEFTTDFYGSQGKVADNPLRTPTKLFPHVVRGGSFEDDPEQLRSAARAKSDPSWQAQDPQIPKSIWYHTDARQVGFRVVRPLVEPTAEEGAAKWDKMEPEINRKQGR